ncbi:MAG: type II toxin-antitoxin system VapB family antitoxin [Desulfuromonadales bacterium]|nr:type II toxin-antitoxin system VapB family antitoxin [Desulfuromonadales bacterium]MBN2792068.1 type II toxin-antitoxin system VapB family antitoxin [Desulfuromonadales bacterium]
MRTTINIDDKIIDELMKNTPTTSRSRAIQAALQEYVEIKKKDRLLALRGKLDIADNWQQLRELEMQGQEPSNDKNSH